MVDITLLDLARRRDKLQRALGGIADMGGLPAAIIVIDTNKEAIAVQEARMLGIPVVAPLDTNCDPADADFGFPGNDDAARAISLYCNLFADAVLDGLAESTAGLGIDLGVSTSRIFNLVPEDSPLNSPELIRGSGSRAIRLGGEDQVPILSSAKINGYEFLACCVLSHQAVFELQIHQQANEPSQFVGRWSLRGSIVETAARVLSAYGLRLQKFNLQVFKPNEISEFEKFVPSLRDGTFKSTLQNEIIDKYPRGVSIFDPAATASNRSLLVSAVQATRDSSLVVQVQGTDTDISIASAAIGSLLSDNEVAGRVGLPLSSGPPALLARRFQGSSVHAATSP